MSGLTMVSMKTDSRSNISVDEVDTSECISSSSLHAMPDKYYVCQYRPLCCWWSRPWGNTCTRICVWWRAPCVFCRESSRLLGLASLAAQRGCRRWPLRPRSSGWSEASKWVRYVNAILVVVTGGFKFGMKFLCRNLYHHEVFLRCGNTR